MAIDIVCNRCNIELTAQGGLLFSPPKGKQVKKYHLCGKCYKKVIGVIGKNF